MIALRTASPPHRLLPLLPPSPPHPRVWVHGAASRGGLLCPIACPMHAAMPTGDATPRVMPQHGAIQHFPAGTEEPPVNPHYTQCTDTTGTTHPWGEGGGFRGHQTVPLRPRGHPAPPQGPNPMLAQGTACTTESCWAARGCMCTHPCFPHPSLCFPFPAPKTLRGFPVPPSLCFLGFGGSRPSHAGGKGRVSMPRLWVLSYFHAQALGCATFPSPNFDFCRISIPKL